MNKPYFSRFLNERKRKLKAAYIAKVITSVVAALAISSSSFVVMAHNQDPFEALGIGITASAEDDGGAGDNFDFDTDPPADDEDEVAEEVEDEEVVEELEEEAEPESEIAEDEAGEETEAAAPLSIDAENVFIYVVKKANEYHYLYSLVVLGEDAGLPAFDPAWAAFDLAEIAPGRTTTTIYYDLFLNGVLQAKVDAWAQKYQKHFPAEMRVYYDDDDITVYHLRQNIYELNDLRLQ